MNFLFGGVAGVFGDLGFEGAMVLALLILLIGMVRANTAKDKLLSEMHKSTLEGLQHSSDSHLAVAKVLSRIEAILGLPNDQNG